MTAPFTGLLAYPITPLHDDGTPDLDGLGALVEAAADAGVDGVVVLATSGAGVSFDAAERDAVVRAAVGAAGGRVPVHAGISAGSAHHVVRHAEGAQAAGASGLVLAPFAYLPLDDASVVALFARVAAVAPDLPVCFYNKPVQLGYDVPPPVLARLAAETTVVAVKDPAALPSRPGGRVAALRHAADVTIGLSGDVAMLDGAEAADAWHSGIAALAPAEYVAVRRARQAATPEAAVARERAWLVEVARTVAATGQPLSALHALAALLGTPTAPPRDALVPLTDAAVAALADVARRRP